MAEIVHWLEYGTKNKCKKWFWERFLQFDVKFWEEYGKFNEAQIHQACCTWKNKTLLGVTAYLQSVS